MRIAWITHCVIAFTLLNLVDLTWKILRLNFTPGCPVDPSPDPDARCFRSCLADNPELQLAVFTSNNTFPDGSEVTKVLHVRNFDYNNPYIEKSTIKIEGNKTLYLHVVLASMDIPHELEHFHFLRRPWFGNLIAVYTTQLTGLKPHRRAPYNLIWDQPTESITKPGELVPHYVSKIYMVGLTRNISLSSMHISKELQKLFLVNYGPIEDLQFLPIIANDVSKIETEDLLEITGNSTSEGQFEFHWEPIGLGELQMMLRPATSSNSMRVFSEELGAEYKKMYFEGSHNIQLYLIVLVFVCAFFGADLLNIYLSRNDKESPRRVEIGVNLFDATELIILCLYFLDVPIHIFAVYYFLNCLVHPIAHLWNHRNSLKLWIGDRKTYSAIHASKEHEAKRIKSRTVKFLVYYFVIPFSLSMATYSLIYHTHTSWYSWSLKSLANGFYTFEFVDKLCNLYANYKVKTVEAQPWYKALPYLIRTIISAGLAIILGAPILFTVFCICDNFITGFTVLQRCLYRSDERRVDSETNVDQACDASETNDYDSCVDSETNIEETSEYEELMNKKEM